MKLICPVQVASQLHFLLSAGLNREQTSNWYSKRNRAVTLQFELQEIGKFDVV